MAYNNEINKGSYILWTVNDNIRELGHLMGISEEIVPAPDKDILKAFGGTFDIEEFRNLTKTKKYCVAKYMYPMMPIPPKSELLVMKK